MTVNQLLNGPSNKQPRAARMQRATAAGGCNSAGTHGRSSRLGSGRGLGPL